MGTHLSKEVAVTAACPPCAPTSPPRGSGVGPPDTLSPSRLRLVGSNPPVPPLGHPPPTAGPPGPPPLANTCLSQPSPHLLTHRLILHGIRGYCWWDIFRKGWRDTPPWGRDISACLQPALGLDSTCQTFPASEAINSETRTFQHRDGPTQRHAMQSASSASRRRSAFQWSKWFWICWKAVALSPALTRSCRARLHEAMLVLPCNPHESPPPSSGPVGL